MFVGNQEGDVDCINTILPVSKLLLGIYGRPPANPEKLSENVMCVYCLHKYNAQL